jgi:hypothetical protein
MIDLAFWVLTGVALNVAYHAVNYDRFVVPVREALYLMPVAVLLGPLVMAVLAGLDLWRK